jgi:hypothetical protein
MSSTRIKNQDLKEGMLVYHALEGELGRVKAIHAPGAFHDPNGTAVSQAVAIVDIGGQEEQFVLPPNGTQFQVVSEAGEKFRDELRLIVDDTIRSLVGRGAGHGLDEETTMKIMVCVIRERMRKNAA